MANIFINTDINIKQSSLFATYLIIMQHTIYIIKSFFMSWHKSINKLCHIIIYNLLYTIIVASLTVYLKVIGQRPVCYVYSTLLLFLYMYMWITWIKNNRYITINKNLQKVLAFYNMGCHVQNVAFFVQIKNLVTVDQIVLYPFVSPLPR